MRNDGRFEALVESQAISGEIVIEVGEESLFLISMLDITELSYAEIHSFYLEGFLVVLETEGGRMLISRLGQDQEVFYQELWKAYNALTAKALFIDPLLCYETKGEYGYSDMGGEAEGQAVIRLYENCLLLLPPNAGGRRVSLRFVKEVQVKEYSLFITLDTGETYWLSKLGRDTGVLYRLLVVRLAAMNKEAAELVKEMDPSLPAAKVGEAARLFKKGGGAPLAELETVALSFAEAARQKIKAGRWGEALACFEELCGEGGVYVGVMPAPAGEGRAALQNPEGEKEGAPEKPETEEAGDRFLLWTAGLTKGGVAAVELAVEEGDAAATYLYRFKGGANVFLGVLTHGMEAVSYKREVISTPSDKLARSDYALYKMAVQRTPYLRLLRSCFCGRAIHSTPEVWKNNLFKQMG